jgi:hypothetical protein
MNLLLAFVFCICTTSYQIWQLVLSNQIAQCQLVQTFGFGVSFVNTRNTSIMNFTMQDNFTFGIVPNAVTNFNAQISLTCNTLTSTLCSDYIGGCPKTTFLISFIKPFIAVVNYRNASSHYILSRGEVVFVLHFDSG